MATSFFYIYIDMYKLMERPVVLLNAIFYILLAYLDGKYFLMYLAKGKFGD